MPAPFFSHYAACQRRNVCPDPIAYLAGDSPRLTRLVMMIASHAGDSNSSIAPCNFATRKS